MKFQGDIMFKRVEKMPAGLKKHKPENGQYILARGEATGHNHVVTAEPTVQLYDDPTTGGMYLVVNNPTEAVHTSGDIPDHAPVPLDIGIYFVTRQVQYEYGQGARRVAD